MTDQEIIIANADPNSPENAPIRDDILYLKDLLKRHPQFGIKENIVEVEGFADQLKIYKSIDPKLEWTKSEKKRELYELAYPNLRIRDFKKIRKESLDKAWRTRHNKKRGSTAAQSNNADNDLRSFPEFGNANDDLGFDNNATTVNVYEKSKRPRLNDEIDDETLALLEEWYNDASAPASASASAAPASAAPAPAAPAPAEEPWDAEDIDMEAFDEEREGGSRRKTRRRRCRGKTTRRRNKGRTRTKGRIRTKGRTRARRQNF